MQYKEELTDFFKIQSKANDFDDIKANVLITSDQLESKHNENPGILLVYRDGCIYCERFKPEFVKIYNHIQNWNENQRKLESDPKERKLKNTDTIWKPFNIFAINSADQKNAAFLKNNDVRGVPTIFLITANGALNEYNGPRDAESILKELQNLKTMKKMYF